MFNSFDRSLSKRLPAALPFWGKIASIFANSSEVTTFPNELGQKQRAITKTSVNGQMGTRIRPPQNCIRARYDFSHCLLVAICIGN